MERKLLLKIIEFGSTDSAQLLLIDFAGSKAKGEALFEILHLHYDCRN